MLVQRQPLDLRERAARTSACGGGDPPGPASASQVITAGPRVEVAHGQLKVHVEHQECLYSASRSTFANGQLVLQLAVEAIRPALPRPARSLPRGRASRSPTAS